VGTGVEVTFVLQNTYRFRKQLQMGFHVDVDYEPQIINDEWLKQYDIIHYHRHLVIMIIWKD
jgi:hypothetical protein